MPVVESKKIILIIVAVAITIGFVSGLYGENSLKILFVFTTAFIFLVYFFSNFEQAVLSLLIIRSSLDVFSAQQIPSAYAVGIIALTFLYAVIQLLTGKTVKTDAFWWFLGSWTIFQGLWIVLLPLGQLGLDSAFLLDGIKEWVRLLSWLMIYLLVTQLRGRLPPQQVINAVLYAMIAPLSIALIQVFAPSLLPPFLAPTGIFSALEVAGESRISGTFGHSSTFAVFLAFSIGIVWWKLAQAKRRMPWVGLLLVLAFLLAAAKSLAALTMLVVFILFMTIPRLNLISLFGGILVIGLAIALFANTEFGQVRISSLFETPLLNPEIDRSRAILLSESDANSFNWRIAQWTFLLQAWQKFPIFGYGFGASVHLTDYERYAHSDYIRSLVETGIVGLFSFLIFLGIQIIYLIKSSLASHQKSPKQSLCTVLLAILVSMLVAMITDNIWYHTSLMFYWWTIFSLLSWDWDNLQQAE